MKTIAFHLPQFHPIPENDRWWGRGFTEWTNVVKATPQFRGHYQPHLPADLGFYDLRLPEVRAAQAEMAQQYGINAFCYYHYWFNGKRLIERPVNDILSSGEPDFPFCLCWANENWTRRWDGQEREILLGQNYSADDDLDHIRTLLPSFHDPRYVRVGGKPLFLVYRSTAMPEPKATAERWRREAERAGLPGLYLVRVESHAETADPIAIGFDAAVEFAPFGQRMHDARVRRAHLAERLRLGIGPRLFAKHQIFSYPKLVDASINTSRPAYPWIRSVTPGWDNTARRKQGAIIFADSTPADFGRWTTELMRQATQHVPAGADEPMLFVNAWNEWAEGNHLEPCQKWGHAYLEAFREARRAIAGA